MNVCNHYLPHSRCRRAQFCELGLHERGRAGRRGQGQILDIPGQLLVVPDDHHHGGPGGQPPGAGGRATAAGADPPLVADHRGQAGRGPVRPGGGVPAHAAAPHRGQQLRRALQKQTLAHRGDQEQEQDLLDSTLSISDTGSGREAQ